MVVLPDGSFQGLEYQNVILSFTPLYPLARLVTLGHIVLDGTMANASKHKAMSHGRIMKEKVRLYADHRAAGVRLTSGTSGTGSARE